MIITDSQMHIWNVNSADDPWPDLPLTRRGERPPFEVSDIIAEMDKEGVARTVLVPSSWTGQSNRAAKDAAAKYPDRLSVMGRIDLQQPRKIDREEWLSQTGMLGFRLTFFQPNETTWLTDGTADWFWTMAEEIDLPVMVLAPGQTAKLGEVAKDHPGLRILLDHLNIGTLDQNESFPHHIDELLPLAQYPNISVKLSALPCYVPDYYPFPSLRPEIIRVLDTFGPDRSMWGSDLSRLTCGYHQWIEMFMDTISYLSIADQELVMGGAVSNWLNWPTA